MSQIETKVLLGQLLLFLLSYNKWTMKLRDKSFLWLGLFSISVGANEKFLIQFHYYILSNIEEKTLVYCYCKTFCFFHIIRVHFKDHILINRGFISKILDINYDICYYNTKHLKNPEIVIVFFARIIFNTKISKH